MFTLLRPSVITTPGLRLASKYSLEHTYKCTYSCFLNTRLAHSRAAKKLESNLENKSSPPPDVNSKPESDGKGPEKPNKIMALTPKFLHRYLQRYFQQVTSAPASHITAFLILHELTAIVPLAGLWWTFHHFGFVPTGLPDWIMAKGIGYVQMLADKYQWDLASKAATSSKFLMEGAAAYGIVKLTLPIRALFSVAMMPWFARVFVLPITGLFKRKRVVDQPVNNSSSDVPGPVNKHK